VEKLRFLSFEFLVLIFVFLLKLIAGRCPLMTRVPGPTGSGDLSWRLLRDWCKECLRSLKSSEKTEREIMNKKFNKIKKEVSST